MNRKTIVTIQKQSIATAYGIHTQNNRKEVFCMLTGKIFASVSDAAEYYGIAKSTMSYRLAHPNQSYHCFVRDIPEYIETISQHMMKQSEVYNEVQAWNKANEELAYHEAQRNKLSKKLEAENKCIAELKAQIESLKTSNNTMLM